MPHPFQRGSNVSSVGMSSPRHSLSQAKSSPMGHSGNSPQHSSGNNNSTSTRKTKSVTRAIAIAATIAVTVTPFYLVSLARSLNKNAHEALQDKYPNNNLKAQSFDIPPMTAGKNVESLSGVEIRQKGKDLNDLPAESGVAKEDGDTDQDEEPQYRTRIAEEKERDGSNADKHGLGKRRKGEDRHQQAQNQIFTDDKLSGEQRNFVDQSVEVRGQRVQYRHPTNMFVNLQNSAKRSKKKKDSILVVVPSLFTSDERRISIRKSWANKRNRSVFFIINRGGWEEETLRKEFDTYGDVICIMNIREVIHRKRVIDEHDAMTFLTEVFTHVVHAQLGESSYGYIIKASDQSYLNVDVATKTLLDHKHPADYWGHCINGTEVEHVSLLARVSRIREYPPYAVGTAYALSSSFVSCAVKKSIKSRIPFPREDTAIGILAQRCGVKCIDEPRIYEEQYGGFGELYLHGEDYIGYPQVTTDHEMKSRHVCNCKRHGAANDDSCIGFEKEISQKNPVEFVHITKTGGSAVELVGSMAGVIWGACHYITYEGLQCFCPDLVRSNMKVSTMALEWGTGVPLWHIPNRHYTRGPFAADVPLFTVIRNPYDRIMSTFYCQWNGPKEWSKNDMKSPAKMNKWVQEKMAVLLDDEETRRTSLIWYPQYLYTFDIDGKQRIETLVRYENMKAEFDIAMAKYGLNISLPVHKTNAGPFEGATRLTASNLNVQSLRLINRYYADDFRLLNYTMLGPSVSSARV